MKNKRLSFGIVVVIAMIMLCVLAFGSLCTPKVFALNTEGETDAPLDINAYIDNATFVNSYKEYFNDRYAAPSLALKEDLNILNIALHNKPHQTEAYEVGIDGEDGITLPCGCSAYAKF